MNYARRLNFPQDFRLQYFTSYYILYIKQYKRKSFDSYNKYHRTLYYLDNSLIKTFKDNI